MNSALWKIFWLLCIHYAIHGCIASPVGRRHPKPIGCAHNCAAMYLWQPQYILTFVINSSSWFLGTKIQIRKFRWFKKNAKVLVKNKALHDNSHNWFVFLSNVVLNVRENACNRVNWSKKVEKKRKSLDDIFVIFFEYQLHGVGRKGAKSANTYENTHTATHSPNAGSSSSVFYQFFFTLYNLKPRSLRSDFIIKSRHLRMWFFCSLEKSNNTVAQIISFCFCHNQNFIFLFLVTIKFIMS